MTFRGFKSLIFVGGSSNNVYAIDYDFGTMFWRTHHNYTAGAREYAGSPTCPGGMTLPLTRATTLAPADAARRSSGLRGRRVPRKGMSVSRDKGAPQLAEIAARIASRGNRGGGDAAATGRRAGPRAAAGARDAAACPWCGSARERHAQAARGPNFVFSVAADGLLRGLIPDTGDLALAPARFLPANATATGLIWADGFVYAATSNTCGGAPTAVYAMDFMAEHEARDDVAVGWRADRGPRIGMPTARSTSSTGGGGSHYANSIVALDGKTLKLKDWLTARRRPSLPRRWCSAKATRPMSRPRRAAGCIVLDAASLGGADHRTPLFVTQDASGVSFSNDGIATWRDAAGTRWILAEVSSAIAAFKLVDKGGAPALERVWSSRKMASPRTPIVVNGVVFALAGGNIGASAVLYALDPATGQGAVEQREHDHVCCERAACPQAQGRCYVVTADNTVYAFGIPLAIN